MLSNDRDVWEWTSSEFMDIQVSKVDLTNIMTSGLQIRKFYAEDHLEHHQNQSEDLMRNFFRLDERWLISGFRCVEETSRFFAKTRAKYFS